VIRVVVFEADGSLRCGGEELQNVAPPPGGAVWVDFEGGASRKIEPWLAEQGFHPLAIEDTFTLHHQPKVEEYGDHLFVIVRGLDFNAAEDPATGELSTLKLAAFLTADRLVTYHRAPMRSVSTVYERLQGSPSGFPHRHVQVLWALADEILDLYTPVLDAIGDEIENLEEKVVSDPEQGDLERLLAARRRLSTLRRNLLPQRQIFGHLAGSRFGPIDDTAGLNFRDTQDSAVRLVDSIEQQRDLLNNVKDTYLSVIGQRTNDIMRVLTVISAIILPLSLLAGIYGMNFDHMPELHTRWGYFVLLGGMASLAGGLLVYFKKKGWL